jgi:ADP-ribose pyrophosphatase YjhB (NUDIX family)
MTTPRRVNVRGIIFKDGKLLAQQLTPGSDGITRDYWCTPGGGLNDGESLHQGLHRELIEETGIAPKIGKLLFVQQFHDGKKEQLEFFFHIENPEDYVTIDLAATSHGEAEITNVNFIDAQANHVLPKFLTNTDIQSYIDLSLPVFVDSELE